MANVSFRPVQGTEAQIKATEYQEGYVYFATDSKKIYLDANGEAKLPMGGNSGIYYGLMELEGEPPENQTEFEFTVYDIEGNEEGERLNIPNVDDLILNKDGCFYRVIELLGVDENTVIVTNKLTLAGGNGPAGPGEDVGSYKLTASTPKSITILYKQPYSIGFKAVATDSEGDETGSGTYELQVGGRKVDSGIAKQGENLIPIQKFLELGENKIRLVVYMDIGGSALVSQSLKYTITTTEMEVEWDYSQKVNYTTDNFVLNYSVKGEDISKTVTLVIDDIHSLTIAENLTSTDEQPFTFTPALLEEYGLKHGAHVFRLQAHAYINGNLNYSYPVSHSIMFVEPGNSLPVISYELFDTNLTQYNTVFIPVTIYSSTNIAGDAEVELNEETITIDRWPAVENLVTHIWTYTPLTAGPRLLSIKCGLAEVRFTVQVAALGIGKEEVKNYAYRFKASDFASANAVQNWNSNGVTATFSDAFDWINGGLISEKDENNNNRQYLCIKAGSQMRINHQLFKANAKAGKTLKVIFKTANCRDYDARVLECKKDTKIIRVNSDTEYYLPFNTGDTLVFGETILNQNNNINILDRVQSYELDPNNATARNVLNNKFIERFEPIDLLENDFIPNYYYIHLNDEYVVASTFEEGTNYFKQQFYQIKFGEVETEEETNEKLYYTYFYKTNIVDSFEGFIMNAQYAILNSRGSTISTQYCEDSYIELEFDISKIDSGNSINPKNYIKFWIDGVPSGFVIYSEDDSFMTAEDSYLTIGSNDCDVHLYMIKLYEKSLTDDEHLDNFIVDASNAMEMLNRFKRNDIMDPNRKKEVSPTKLALANPNCLVHVYETNPTSKEGMPITKKTKRKGCIYTQYHNSDTAVLTATDVTIKVQGTSSEKYVVSAANIDAEFTTGFTDVVKNEHLDGWSMDGGSAIPVNFFCTKVNVASCEHANNALNQEWYNMFQPYKTVVRYKNPGARDTMQFTNGVMFVKDWNQTYNTDANADKKANNVFGEVAGYMSNPYPKLYSIANMGNSKKNIEVFHDHTNPLECCVEVADNQTAQQWMVNDKYNKEDIGEGQKYFEFRYPDGIDGVKERGENGQRMIQAWNDFVSWMAHSNPQPRYEKHTAHNEEEYRTFAFNPKTQKDVLTYHFEDKNDYVLTGYDPTITEYYTETDHIYGYTNKPLGPEVTKVDYKDYTFVGYKVENQKKPDGTLWQEDYKPKIAGCTVNTYNYQNFVTKDAQGNMIEDPNNYIAQPHGFTHDTYEYRMAKMLHECEEHLVMDSVIYHYLFIERHTMIDNVAKNTFWSTEDCQHWNLTKDYDNDTADGNDNQGKFTRTYGMEVMDKLNESTHVFNAHQSVWLNFIHGLYEARRHMYDKIEADSVTYNGRELKCWSATDYLWLFKEWQSRIPERCWIEDYKRKYFRPYEVYKDTMFISMMEGGQKTHQRKQYETYQNIYMSSEYMGTDAKASDLTIRSNGQNMLNAPLAVEVYSDCYIQMDTGSDTSLQRVKRNEKNYFRCPTNNLNNATMHFYPAKVFSVIGSTVPGEGMLGDFYPEQVKFANAGKLRELVVSTIDNGSENTSLKKDFDLLGNPMLEVLYAANLTAYDGGLNLSGCANLREVDARNSTFTSVEIADNAPVEIIRLHEPTSLSLSNSYNLHTLEIDNYGRLTTLKLTNVDNDYIKSLDIVNSCYNLSNYRLTNVDWTLENITDVDSLNKEIKILETLLDKHPIEDITTETGYEPLSKALTGKLTVTSSAYNGTDSFEMYNKYVQDEVYPNLDIEFTGDSAKLYSVEIYDGNDKVFWHRKINKNLNVDEEFLSDGPKGAFDINAIYKSNTAANIFTFTGNWNVYDKDNLETPIDKIERTDKMPYYNNVNANIVIIPEFLKKDREYTLKFYGVDQNNPLVTKQCKYGMTWAEVQPNIVPYKEPPENLYEAWDFKGYGLLKNSQTPVPDTYTVVDDQSFYAIFEFLDDVRSVVHEEWFTYTDIIYHQDSYYEEYAPKPLMKEIAGYAISPKVSLKGKITIPSMYNGKPVVTISSYFATDQNSNLEHDITHIFCAEDSNLLEIGSYAFQGTNLQYFDFSQDTVRAIGSYAFNRCQLDAKLLNLSQNLFYVGSSGFLGGIKSSETVIIRIPANLALVYDFGFNNPNVGEGSTWEIGDENNYSKLYLSWPGVSNDQMSKFRANDRIMSNVIFYSERYKNWDEYILDYNANPPIESTMQVYRAFIGPGQSIDQFNLTMHPKEVI